MPKKSPYVPINPKILKWAREIAGLSIEEVAYRTKYKPKKITDLENGDLKITLAELKKFRILYKRPSAIFFLNKIPHDPEIPKDFRGINGLSIRKMLPETLTEIRKAQYKRNQALELKQKSKDLIMPFKYKVILNRDIEDLAQEWRAKWELDLKAQKKLGNEYKAFNFWKKAIEDQGVLVFQASFKPLEKLNGLAIYHEKIPIILLNTRNSVHDRIFAMLHEFCHLLLRRSRIGDMQNYQLSLKHKNIEVFCNAFASACLLSKEDLESELNKKEYKDEDVLTLKVIDKLSKKFKVKGDIILRRFADMNLISYASFLRYFKEISQKNEKPRSKGIFMVPPDIRAIAYNGRSFTSLIMSSLNAGSLTAVEASAMLNLKPKHFRKLQQKIFRSE
ncbi:MAG: ImmA/IrrE family metallo-endopeptidase [Gammaproteobacteria bacterium]|jgi:Zn-dependent peptidase ImmA (M78 family)|nr:ImmA/IrrE family metallo-endopeptidase [Gammaproteobacteria bacterium]